MKYRYWIFFAVFAIYAMAWNRPPAAAPDTGDYVDFARKLVTHEWHEPHDRAPGYPLVLILTGSVAALNRALFFLQLGCHMIAAALLYWALRLEFQSPWPARLAAALLLSPPFVASATVALTESLTGSLLAAAVYFYWQHLRRRDDWYWPVLSGISVAGAFLLRPGFALAGIAISLPLLAHRNRESGSSRFLAPVSILSPALLCCFGIMLVHFEKFEYWGLSPKTGSMLFTRTLSILERIPDSQSELREALIEERDRALTKRGSSHTGTQFMWDGGEKRLRALTGLTKVELSRRLLKLNLGLIASAPLSYSAVVLRTAAGMWNVPPISGLGLSSRPLQIGWATLWIGLVSTYLIGLAWTIMTWISCLATRFHLQIPGFDHHLLTTEPAWRSFVLQSACHALIWYNVLISSAVEVGDPRYNIPCLPLIVVATTLFAASMSRRTSVHKAEIA